VVAELARVLKPGGALIISVPNASSLFRQAHSIERAVTAPLRTLLGHGERRYRQFRWNEATIARLLSAHGFGIEAVEYCTYGVKTPLFERRRANISFCTWASERYHSPSAISRHLAWTLVALARVDSSGRIVPNSGAV
jgi:SAM-dependent methyltransferase